MKKLLVMGSDFGSLDLVKEAKSRGLYVITADLMKSSPTKDASDEAWLINIRDVDEMEIKCREKGIDAVTVGVNDINITCFRELCKRLNLPMYCPNDISWEASTNKRVFKDVAKSVGARVAEDFDISIPPTKEQLEVIKYPVVVKPIDGQGNLGMSYCHNENELLEALNYAKDISKSGKIICERELRGPEFAVNYIIADGKPQLLYLSSEHTQPGSPANNYNVIIVTPGHLKQYLEEMNDYVIEIFKKIGCVDGIAWVETILDEDGYFHLLEMGHRFGGEMIYSAYGKVIGFNIIGYMLDTALGIKHKVSDLPNLIDVTRTEIAGSYHFFTKNPGVIKSIEGLEQISKLPNIDIDIPRREGSNIKANGQMGVIRIYAKNCNQFCETISKINQYLIIKNIDGEDMFTYFTDMESLKQEFQDGISDFQ